MRITILTLLLFFPVLVFAQDLPSWAEVKLNSVQDFQQSDFLSPSFFESDFNGDGKNDIAVPVVNEGKFGIAFFLKDDSVFVAGAGKPFGPGGNNFSWADEWKVFKKEKTYQITFKENGDIDDEEEILLENPAISIRQSEGSGGLIYFNGEKFIRAVKSNTVCPITRRFKRILTRSYLPLKSFSSLLPLLNIILLKPLKRWAVMCPARLSGFVWF